MKRYSNFFPKVILVTVICSIGLVHYSEAQVRKLPADTTVVTENQVTVKGERINYITEAGTQPVWGEDGHPIASLFYVYYTKKDVDDISRRPLIFSFNGGPGSASVWMHIGYTGPRFLKIDPEGHPVQPYGVEENHNSILDVADIVYIDPVNTGFSRVLDEEVDREEFFGVNADIEYLAEWLENFVSRHDRWTSPKYLIGESYGTTRVSGLAHELQNSEWMFVNGVILVSPTELGLEPPAMSPRSEILKLPYYAAAAWYHDALDDDLQSRDLDELLPEVEQFTIEEYLPAVARGGSLSNDEREAIAEQVSHYSAISKQDILDHNLTIPTSFFWKELLRDKEITIGRLDSRYRGVDTENAGERYDHDPALTSWNHAFTPAINHYLREQLNFKTDLQYNIFGPVHPWNDDDDTTGEDLRRAMGENPYLHVMVQSGYFDGATDYFSAKYSMWNLDRSGKMWERIHLKGYRSGHMMYLRQEDLKTANDDIREFIQTTTTNGKPAKY